MTIAAHDRRSGGLTRLRRAIETATECLAAAGVPSPRVDAEELAAHLAGTDRGRLLVLAPTDDEFFRRYDELVAARAQRIPLQHLIGTAAFGPLVLRVGPGVFIPRPETESVLEWACAQELPDAPVIVDLCTGSGALALALAAHRPHGRVIGVDDSAEALRWAHRNLDAYIDAHPSAGVELLDADVTSPGLLPELDGRVDLIVANPPYIPDGSALEPEVARHDPPHALFGGADGMAVISAVVALARRWLRPGAAVAVEHDETTSAATAACFDPEHFDQIVARRDLAGRPRFVTARRRR